MSEQKTEKPKHLGRGLASLISPIISGADELKSPIPIVGIQQGSDVARAVAGGVQEIKIEAIQPNPYQVRTTWDEQELADLAASIKANGIIQPVLVRKTADGYQLIAGERRCRAAKMVLLETIPAIVRQASEPEMLELALVENIHRSDLNPIERAKAYQSYINTFSLTQAEAAERLGEDRSVVANYLRLLELPDEIKRMLKDRQLTMGHARAILALPTEELRRKLANRAMVGRLSVREVERLVRRYLGGSEKPVAQPRPKAAHISDLENRLTSYLGTRASIESRRNGQSGRIVIEFYSLDEFDRILERIGLPSTEEV